MADKTKEQLSKELQEALSEIQRLNEGMGFTSAELGRYKQDNEALNSQVKTLLGRVTELEDQLRLTEEKHGVLGQGFSEEQIREKIRAGLDFDQAIEVLIAQRTQDEAASKAAAE